MLSPRTPTVFVVAATALLLAHSHVRADYMFETVPLISQQFGVTAGTVVGEANNGTTAVNGLLPGQVRLTFTADPLSVYTQNGAGLGFATLNFYTNLSLSIPPPITLPAGWLAEPAERAWPPPGGPIAILPTRWDVLRDILGPGGPSVTITINGLGNSAILNHFLPPAFTISGELEYPGAGGTFAQDGVVGTTASTAPEPSTLAMAAAGVVGLVIARRRRRLLRGE